MYSLSMSKADQRKGIAGERQWFWVKDTNAKNRLDTTGPEDVLYLCDVDYYVDMPSLLGGGGKPILVYTVVPEEASGTKDDTTFYFESDASLTSLISGGGRYNHHLWDYGADSILGVKRFMGVPYLLTAYAVERRQVSYSRQLILLTPIRTWRGFGALLASLILEGRELVRFNPILVTEDGNTFVRFKVHTKDGTMTTTARPGETLCATVPSHIDEAIGAAARVGSQKMNVPTATSWLGKDEKARFAGVVLTDFYQHHTPRKIPFVFPVTEAVRTYDYNVDQYHQGDRAKLTAYMNPLVHGAFCPVPNRAGEEACVEGRINKLKKPEPKQCNFVDQCMVEFAELIVGDVVLEPVEVSTVVDKQTGAGQKLSLARAFMNGPHMKRVLKCFIKSEAYGDVKDPRNISTYNDNDKLLMARYALALSEHLKQFQWYGPGKTPLEIATRVANICQGASYANVSDYHRMDGTITHKLREVDRAVFMKAFRHSRSELHELLKRNCDNVGVLPHGTIFDQGPSHGSGCSATSTSQTLRATFASYVAFRHTVGPTGIRYTPDEAFRAIGIHLGDDGLDADLPIQSHEWAARKLGLVLEANLVNHGERGVNFLARYYSQEVWYGRLDSMCDVRRQLSKFHTTVRLPPGVPPESKLVEKSRGYVATDANTPVIGQLCKRAVALTQDGMYRTEFGLAHWWAKFDESVQFPNNNDDGWMDAEFLHQFPEFDRERFDDWIAGVSHLSQLLGPPLCCEVRAPTPGREPVVVDGSILPKRESDTSTPPPQTAVERPKAPPRHNGTPRTTRARPSREDRPLRRGRTRADGPAGSVSAL